MHFFYYTSIFCCNILSYCLRQGVNRDTEKKPSQADGTDKSPCLSQVKAFRMLRLYLPAIFFPALRSSSYDHIAADAAVLVRSGAVVAVCERYSSSSAISILNLSIASFVSGTTTVRKNCQQI